MSIKIKRIESEMVKVISEIILTEARDNLLKTISITGAEVASDLSFAKIYFTSMSDLDKDTLETEVNEASKFLRMELAEKMNLRNTPKLKFIYDNSIEYGNNIEKILNSLNEEK